MTDTDYNINKLYTDIVKYENFDIGDNTEKFLETVDKIVQCQNPKSIDVLLKYIDDETEYDWVIQSICKAIEHYPMTVYVDRLIKNLPLILKKGPIWTDNFFNRIFNHPEYRQYFREHIHIADKESLLNLLSIMEKESPHHQDLITELRRELEITHQ
jgi:hypothetical protein